MKNILIRIGSLVLVGLVAALVTRSCQQKEEFDKKVEGYKARIATLEDSVAMYQVKDDSLAEVMVHDKEERQNERLAYEAKISKMKNRIPTTNFAHHQPPQLDSVVLALYPIRNDTTYCMPLNAARESLEAAVLRPVYDTLLATTEGRVIELEDEVLDLEMKYETRLSYKDQSLGLKDRIIAEKDKIIDVQEDQIRANKRRSIGRTILWTIGGIAAGVVFKTQIAGD